MIDPEPHKELATAIRQSTHSDDLLAVRNHISWSLSELAQLDQQLRTGIMMPQVEEALLGLPSIRVVHLALDLDVLDRDWLAKVVLHQEIGIQYHA